MSKTQDTKVKTEQTTPKKEAKTPEDQMAAKATTEEFTKIPDKLPILASDNYARWKYDIEVVLRVRELWNVVSGRDAVPVNPGAGATAEAKAAFQKEANEWVTKDYKAKEVICRSLDSLHHDMIRSYKYSSQIWNCLKGVYEQNTGTSVLMIQREFYAIKWEPADKIMAYYTRLRSCANKAEAIGKKFEETAILAKMMADLPNSFTALKESWEISLLTNAGAALTVDQLLSQLIRVEKQHEAETSQEVKNATAYSARPGENKSSYPGNCFNCGRKGHSAARCFRFGGGAYIPDQQNQSVQDPQMRNEQAAPIRGLRPQQHKPPSDGSHRANVGF